MTSDRHLPAHSLRPFEVTIPTPDGAAVADRIKNRCADGLGRGHP